jgi:hypothetical protein
MRIYKAANTASYFVIGGKNLAQGEFVQLSDPTGLILEAGDRLEIKATGSAVLVDALCTVIEQFKPMQSQPPSSGGAGNTVPVITGVPTISGTPNVGQTLSATAATVAGTPTPTRTWQWYRGASPISGATSDTYVLVVADEGKDISVEQIETNIAGLDSAVSSAVTVALALILDNLTATAAWSTRRLGSAYTGNAIRVRRSSNNEELDIGFTASGDLDIAALLDFVGSGNGFVTTWYDQSGNGRHVTQTDPTKQPRIVSNGVMNMVNGRAALSFDGNDSMQRTNIGTVFSTSAGFEFQTVVDLVSRSTSGYTSLPITVMNNPSARVVDGFLIHSPVPLNSHGFTYGPGNTGFSDAWPTFTAYDVSPVNAPPAIIGYNATSNTAALFQNGVQTAVSGSSRTFAQTGITLTIGSRSDAFTSFPGNMSEIVGFGGTLSTTDRKILESNQGAYYGIAVA